MPRGREYQINTLNHTEATEKLDISSLQRISINIPLKIMITLITIEWEVQNKNTDDRRIDNMVERGVYRTHGLSGGSYLHPDRIADRISQQVVSYKMMDNYSRIELQNLYRAANHYNMDLRIFNGLQFYRGY